MRSATLGERESGTARLEEAVAAYRAALKEWTRERVPLDWAMTQNNLGTALQALGERESGTARLEEAVAAYRDALKERTRERVPLDWAMTQNNLGNALSDARRARERHGASRGGGRGLQRVPGRHYDCLAVRMGSICRIPPGRGPDRDRASITGLSALQYQDFSPRSAERPRWRVAGRKTTALPNGPFVVNPLPRAESLIVNRPPQHPPTSS